MVNKLYLSYNLHDNINRVLVLHIHRFSNRVLLQTKGVNFMIKKRISLIGFALLSTITLAACSNNSQSTKASSSSHVKTEQKKSSDTENSSSSSSSASTSSKSSVEESSSSLSSEASSSIEANQSTASVSQSQATTSSNATSSANSSTAASAGQSSIATTNDPWHGYSEAYVRQALISVGANANAVNQIPSATLAQAFDKTMSNPYGTDPGYLWRQLYQQYPALGNPAN
ncbi:RhoGEF Guanine nucleotide exchange factor for Rho-Rac-Cdc42-like GTPases-like [Furfurilactobacillus rossiae]|nr:RhoGEF Guanine nucleotide exchange factor for Rho-Rac-Cdc42-like GTPases-like [Furfurilactobacillus rossiae]